MSAEIADNTDVGGCHGKGNQLERFAEAGFEDGLDDADHTADRRREGPDDQDSRLCRYALRIQPVSESVEPNREMRDYLSCLPRPVLQSMYDFVKGTDRAITPGAEQACRDVGCDLTDPEFRDLVIQVVELSRG